MTNDLPNADTAQMLIREARKATSNRRWIGARNLSEADSAQRLIRDLTDALEREIETSDALRQTVKAYLAADKFRD